LDFSKFALKIIKMKSLYKSEQGKDEIFRLYDEKLKSLNISYESKDVATSFGNTHVIVTGEPHNPPLIIVHGSNACAPIALETYANLSAKFQVYAVDVLAQPNKSAETRLSMKDDSYGKWMNEVMNGLNLDNVILAGFSFGGLVILKTLEHDESKVKSVFLSAPAYIVNGNPIKAILNMFLPMRRFMKTKKTQHVERFLANIFTERDAFAIDYLSQVFSHFKMDFTPVPLIKTERAQMIKTPITLFAAKQDLLFPGEKMIKRASRIFPSLKKAVLLEQSKHVQCAEDNQLIENIILTS